MSEIQYEELLKKRDIINAVAVAIIKSLQLRLLILKYIAKNVATKDDIRELRHYVDIHISILDQRIGGLGKSFDGIDKKIEAIDRRIDGLSKKIDVLGKRIEALDKRIAGLNERITLLQWILAIGFTGLSIILTFITYLVSTLPR